VGSSRGLRPRAPVLGCALIMGLSFPIVMALTGLLLTGSGPSWVLPPTAEPLVRAFVALDGGRLDGLKLSARIDQSKVTLVARDDGGRVTATISLVHPSTALEGATQVGGLAVVAPQGRVSSSLARAALKRLKAHPLKLPWRALGEDGEAERSERRARDEAAQIALSEARYLRAIDDLEGARTKLTALPEDLSVGVWIEVALVQRQLGDVEASKKRAQGIQADSPVDRLAISLLVDVDLDVTRSMAELPDEAVCKAVTIVSLLADLERPKDALSLVETILERAPNCGRAWENALHLRLDQREKPQALELARKIIERFPQDDELLQLAATALSANEAYREAAPILEGVARRHPEQTGVIRVLLSTVLRNPKFRAEKTQEYERRHKESPEDRLVTFLLGVVKHYANAFEESSALLRVVEKEMDHQGRLHIYLAMNDFNQGAVEAAMNRLNRIAERPIPDPDIFYCRAEILRDTNRTQAIADLQRYMAPTGVNILANPEKERRVDQMISLLETCEREGAESCEGPWEHPRFRHHTESKVAGEGTRAPPIGWVLLTVLLVIGGVLGWRRRRAS
jgi:tetratricopeptide (TPR) repeat protein